jgi:transcription elongation factor Elf1
MRKKIKCKICGKRFLPLAENRYEVEDKSLAGLLVSKAEIMEMFDCPRCGCQVLANLRKGHKPNEDS